MKTINKNTCHYPAGLDNPEKGNSHFTRYSGQARVGQNKKAFTLVELIIVITILAILATIAFISFQNFTKDARDGNRTPTPSLTNVNGTCGMAHNTPTPTQPTENLCTNGNATSVTTNTSNYTWSCEGVNLGTTASCSAPRQYTVTFDGNGATSGSMTAQNIQANTSVNLTSNGFTKTGNTFAGWSTTLGGVVVYTNGQSYNMTTSNITLYAKWEIPIIYIQLCTGTPTNGEIYYTDNTGIKLASVRNNGTPTWESGKTISNLTCNTGGGTNNGGHIVVCTGNTTGYVLQACNLGNTGTPGATTTSSAYGNVYQWGRTDTTWAQGSSDWKSPADSELWGVSEANKTTATWANSTDPNKTKMQGPCPTGYHVPTNKEWVDVRTSWENGGTNGTNFSNALQLPFAGFRNWDDGSMVSQGSHGDYWSSSPDSTLAYLLSFGSSSVTPSGSNYRAYGLSVRCFKN